MSGIKRTTRECSVNQLNSQLWQAVQEFMRAHELGDPVSTTRLCCETYSERESLGLFVDWLDGNPDTCDYLGLILTEKWLIWTRHGDRSGTIVHGGKLNEIRVKPFASRVSKETGLQISGNVDSSNLRISGNLALGPDPAAREFCEQAQLAVEKANPRAKKRSFFGIRW